MSSMIDTIQRADFSRETDFKNELYRKLFGQKENRGSGQGKVIGGAMKFQALSIEELGMVNAAGNLHMQQAQKEKSDKK